MPSKTTQVTTCPECGRTCGAVPSPAITGPARRSVARHFRLGTRAWCPGAGRPVADAELREGTTTPTTDPHAVAR